MEDSQISVFIVITKLRDMRFTSFLLLITMASCSTAINYPEGGYDYPNTVLDKDTNFYYYPIKDLLSRRDSFKYGAEYLFLRNFNEPNLSLRPMNKEEFRFVYTGWAIKTYIILIRKDTITIKSGDTDTFYEPNDKLTEIEKQHLNILARRFPLDGPQQNPAAKKYYDSLAKVYPQLLDPQYYLALQLKRMTRNNKTFDSTKIAIKKEDFNSLVNLFNVAGFWTMPFEVKCGNPTTDGYGFILEANTKNKYKIVNVNGCPTDTSKFTKACQTLIEYLHLGNEIHLIWTWSAPSRSFIVKDVQLEEIKAPVKHKKAHHPSIK